MIPWIGSITCEASVPGRASVPGVGFLLSVWNTATLKITATCSSFCSWLAVIEEIQDLIHQVYFLVLIYQKSLIHDGVLGHTDSFWT